MKHPAEEVEVLGDPALLRLPLLAIFASVAVPPDLIFPAVEFAERLRVSPVALIGGFHTPLERCLLEVLARGEQRIVVCPAQRIDSNRLTDGTRRAIGNGRLALVSLAGGAHRPTSDSGAKRNALVVRLAGRLLIVHARAGSRTFRAAAHAIELGRDVYAFDHRRNTDLFLIGAKPLSPKAKIPEDWGSDAFPDAHGAHSVQDDHEARSHVGEDRHPQCGPTEYR